VLWLNGTITASVDNYDELMVLPGSYSGDTWALQGDGRRKSPAIGNFQTTITRYNFTTAGANTSLVINLDISSQNGSDYALVGNLDSPVSRNSYYGFSSGSVSKTITILVPSTGSHFVEISYDKDSSGSSGSDCAWFTIEHQGISWYIDGVQITGQTASIFVASAHNYSLGTHSLTVIATKGSDGKSYSKSVNFTIVEE
jgi:hypothetical protein